MWPFKTRPVSSKTHDYTRLCWGHNINVIRVNNQGETLNVVGWGSQIKKGDYILLNNKEFNSTTRYQFKSIEYYSDPKDMWKAELVFSPRGQ